LTRYRDARAFLALGPELAGGWEVCATGAVAAQVTSMLIGV